MEKGFYMVTMHSSTFESWGWKQSKGTTLIQSDKVTFNGDDTIALFNPNGIIVDLYGEHGVDGTGKLWFVFLSNKCPLRRSMQLIRPDPLLALHFAGSTQTATHIEKTEAPRRQRGMLTTGQSEPRSR